jgi:hypothetical protein
MSKADPSLLGYHSSNGTAAVGRLPISTEGYGPLVQRHIVVVLAACGLDGVVHLGSTIRHVGQGPTRLE